MHNEVVMVVALAMVLVCLCLSLVSAPTVGLRAGSDLLPAALAAAITVAGKFTQAQREPSVNDGGVQHLPDYETEVMQGWEPKQVTDAMSTALGPWFVQYAPAFEEQNVTGAVLRRLSEGDLRDSLGVSLHAHRTLIHHWLSPHRPPPSPPPEGIDLWALCERHRRECHVLLQGMRFIPRMVGMAIYLGLPQLCEWLIPANPLLHGAFVFCYSLQPHLALSVVLCSQWSTCWFLQLCLINVALHNIMSAVYNHFYPPRPRVVFNRFLYDQALLTCLCVYWVLFPYVPRVVTEAVLYLTLCDELLRLLLGGMLLAFGTSIGLFVLLLGMRRGLSADDFVQRLLLTSTPERGQRWPPALDVPAWMTAHVAAAAEADGDGDDDHEDDSVPARFVCPISKCVMTLPTLVCSSGLTYDYDGISRWVRERRSDPQTRERCGPSDLAPNRALYGEISEWVEKRRRRRRRQRLMAAGADLRFVTRGTWLHWVHEQLALPYDWQDDAADEDYKPDADSTRSNHRGPARSLSPDDDLDHHLDDEEVHTEEESQSESDQSEPQPRANRRQWGRGRREGELVGGWMRDAATTAGIVGRGTPLVGSTSLEQAWRRARERYC